MSTRSLIGKLLPNGNVLAVYCHYDGYVEGVGAMLGKHYQDERKIDELLALGDLSCLGEEIGEKHPFDRDGLAEDRRESHKKWDELYGGMCLAYGRDRGEEGCEATIIPRAAYTYAAQLGSYGAEYLYLWTGNEWKVQEYEKPFVSVQSKL